MAPAKNKRHKPDEDNEAFVKEAPETLSWLWHSDKAPVNLTYACMLQMSEQAWKNDKICLDEFREDIREKLVDGMNAEELKKFENYYGLAQELEILRLRNRIRKVLCWKLRTMSLTELAYWEEEANKESQ
jgi:hypothetical protein